MRYEGRRTNEERERLSAFPLFASLPPAGGRARPSRTRYVSAQAHSTFESRTVRFRALSWGTLGGFEQVVQQVGIERRAVLLLAPLFDVEGA